MEISEQLIIQLQQDFRKSRALAEKALSQLTSEQFFIKPETDSNSIAILIQHLSGNMISRWTDFYATDGEKENRNRDKEFEDQQVSQDQLMEAWERGWSVFFSVLDALKPEDLERTIYIRKEAHSVLQAFIRQHSHYNYHIGQIVQLAKMLKGGLFVSLSIPKNQSEQFNKSFR